MQDNLAVMSIGFLLASPNDAVIWRGPKKNGELKSVLGQMAVIMSAIVCCVLLKARGSAWSSYLVVAIYRYLKECSRQS